MMDKYFNVSIWFFSLKATFIFLKKKKEKKKKKKKM